MTLLEIAVASAILAVVIGGAFFVFLKIQVGMANEAERLTVQQTGWRVIERIASELSRADPLSVLPIALADSNEIRFKKVIGFESGFPVLSSELGFDLDSGRTGVSNWGSEVGETLALKDESGTWIPIARNILDIRFSAVQGGVEYEVDVGMLDREGVLTQRTFRQRATFRN